MRIVFVTPEFVTEEYFSGGLANYLHRFSSALAELGHDVHVIVRSPVRDQTLEHRGVTVHRVTARLPELWARALLRLTPRDAQRWLRFAIAAWRKVEALDQEARVDVVQLSNLEACGLFVVAFSRVPHLTRLSSLHSAWRDAAAAPRTLGGVVTQWLEMLQLRRSRHLIAPSQTLASAVGGSRGIRRVEVVRSPAFIETHGLDDGVFRSRLAHLDYLLFVGRYERHKGVQVLAEALPAVLEAIPSLEMVFVGRDAESEHGPSMAAYVRQRCARFESRVHFFGETRHERLYPIVAGARMLVLPSLVDNLPNAALEAMCLGRPVLGTVGASFDEIIEDGKSGFLVRPGDPGALADKIIEAWNRPDLEAIGENARTAVQAFAPEQSVSAALEHFRRVAAAGR